QKENQNNQNEYHAANEVPFNGVGSDADEVAAVVIGPDFHIGRKNVPVQVFGFLLDAFEHVLCLLAAAHQDDPFDSIVVIFLRGLETKDAKARRVTNFDAANIFHSNRRAVVAADHDFAYIVRVPDEA